MQVDIRQQRRDHRPLRSPYLRLRPLPSLRHPGFDPFPGQPQHPRVRHPLLDPRHQLFMVNVVEEAPDVGVQYPVHLLPHDPRRQSIQCIVGALVRPEAIREAYKVLLVDRLQDRRHRLLDDLILERDDAQRSLPSVGFLYVDSPHGLRAVAAPMNTVVKIAEALFQTLCSRAVILLPRHLVHSRRRPSLKSRSLSGRRFLTPPAPPALLVPVQEVSRHAQRIFDSAEPDALLRLAIAPVWPSACLDCVGAREQAFSELSSPACLCPCPRFASGLTTGHAGLGVRVAR